MRRTAEDLSYAPLSEPRMVAAQLRNRWKLDPTFYPVLSVDKTRLNPDLTAGVFKFSEAAIQTYIDQERLIKTSGLSKSERWTVEMMMRGYTSRDQEEINGRERQTYEQLFRRAVYKICEMNDKQWFETHSKQRGA